MNICCVLYNNTIYNQFQLLRCQAAPSLARGNYVAAPNGALANARLTA
jgi:hypothetical protein